MKALSTLPRLAHILRVLARHALSHAVAQAAGRWPWLGGWPWLKPMLNAGGLPGPDRLRIVLEDMGGSLIKLGQMLALQPDLLPMAYCKGLANLMDRVSPFNFAAVELTISEELGSKPSELFDWIDRQPIATASIGQVHVAVIGERKLAVKVQRPTAEQDFAGDVRLIVAAVRLIQCLRVKRLYWVIDPLTEFAFWTREELDYRCEARYMEQVRSKVEGDRRQCVPAVLPQYTTRRILVTEFLEGVSVLDFLRARDGSDRRTLDRLESTGFDPHQFARNIIDNFLGDAFRHGMFHADLHAANLMILPWSVVGYVDFGITGVLSSYSRHHLIALTLAYSRGDLDGMCSSFTKISTVTSDSDAWAFRGGLDDLAKGWYHSPGDGPRLRKSITTMMMELLALSRKSSIYPECDVIKYIRSAIALDGLIRRVAPGFDVGLHLESVCQSQLNWEARRMLFSYNSLLDWSSASVNLMEDGFCRMTNLLERIEAVAAGGPKIPDIGRQSALVRRLVRLGMVVLTASLLMFLFRDGAQLGANVFTADLAVMTFSALALLRGLPRLT